MASVESEAVWVEQGHEAIGDDPRVSSERSSMPANGPGCETERDSSAAGDGAAATGWRYVGLEYVAGRPTHHVTCVGDIWIDIETRLILRTKGPAVDDAGQPIPVEITEVTEIAFGEQPAAVFEPPDGVTRMSLDAYLNYICARDLPNEIIPGISDCPSRGSGRDAAARALADSDAHRPPDPSDCAVPSSDPSEPIGPLAWTPESLNEDWPAPVRPETAGGGSVQPMPRTYLDRRGDNGSTAHPCVDISWVMADTTGVQLMLVSNRRRGRARRANASGGSRRPLDRVRRRHRRRSRRRAGLAIRDRQRARRTAESRTPQARVADESAHRSNGGRPGHG